MNETARIPDILGFAFDSSSVLTEKANVNAVISEYHVPISTGSVDLEEYIPKYREALINAGIEKILAEQQRQLDEFLRAKGLKK